MATAMIPRAGTATQRAALNRSALRRKQQAGMPPQPGVTPPVTPMIPKAVSGPSGAGPTGYIPPTVAAGPGRGDPPPPPMTTSNSPTFYTPAQQTAAAPANVSPQPGSPAATPPVTPPATPAAPAAEDFTGSPLYQFQLEQGQKALNAKLASLGLYDSGASLQATKDFVGKLGAEEAARAQGVKDAETARQDTLKQNEANRLQDTEKFNWDNLYRFLGLAAQQTPQPDNVAATGQAANLATTEGKTKGDFALRIAAKERSSKRRKAQKAAKTKADTKAAV